MKPLPSTPSELSDLKKFTHDMNAYLEDHFGMRISYLKTSNKIKYHLFNELISPQITVGKGGFIFFNSHSTKSKNKLIQFACGQISAPQSYKKEVQEGYAYFLDYLMSKGVIGSFALIPIKARIYPEKLPSQEYRWCGKENKTWFDQMMINLKNQGYSVYHPLELMKALKPQLDVYLSGFFHWHGKITAYIAQDMIKNLWQLELNNLVVEPLEVSVQSDLKSHLVGIKLHNNSAMYDYPSQGVKKCTTESCKPNLERYFSRTPPVHVYEHDSQSSKVLVITSDSFGGYIAEHYIRGFNKVVLINISGINKSQILAFYEHIIGIYQPTHVLNLIHEGGIYGANKNNQQLKQQISEKQALN